MTPFLIAACYWPMKPVVLEKNFLLTRFDAAKLIVSLGADFLGTWLSRLNLQRIFNRKKDR
jgi:hypothetical protein